MSAAIASALLGGAVAWLTGGAVLPVLLIVVGTLAAALPAVRSVGVMLKKSADYLRSVAAKDYGRYSAMAAK